MIRNIILAGFVLLCLRSVCYADVIQDIKKGRLDIIKKRLEKNPNLIVESNEKKFPLVAIAVDNKEYEIAKFLVENKADPAIFDDMGRTALHAAVARQNLEMVKYLIEKGMDVNTKNKYSETALPVALFYTNIEITKYLIEKGADINAKDRPGNPVIHALQIEKKNFKELFNLLWAVKDKQGNHVLDLEAKDQFGETVLMACLTNTDGKEAAQILIAAGAKLEGKSKDDETPFLAAVIHKHDKVVELLLKREVDVNAVDKKGRTALYHAMRRNPKWIKALLERGATVSEDNRKFVKYLKDKDVVAALFDKYADKNNKLWKQKQN